MNTASRMESMSSPGRITLSETSARLLSLQARRRRWLRHAPRPRSVPLLRPRSASAPWPAVRACSLCPLSVSAPVPALCVHSLWPAPCARSGACVLQLVQREAYLYHHIPLALTHTPLGAFSIAYTVASCGAHRLALVPCEGLLRGLGSGLCWPLWFLQAPFVRTQPRGELTVKGKVCISPAPPPPIPIPNSPVAPPLSPRVVAPHNLPG